MGVVDYLVLNGILLSETRGGVESDYIADPLGSTAALVSTAGAITDTFTYWPYGQVRSHVGSSVTPYQYCGTRGYYADGTSGRLYVGARSYELSLTRWLSVDSLWPDIVPYAYAFSNPCTLTDPSGDSPCLGGAGANSRPDWPKCVKKCGTIQEDSADWGKCMAKCLGKQWVKKNFLDHICEINPNICEDTGGQPPCSSPLRYTDITYCFNCAHAYFIWCMAIKGKSGATGCDTQLKNLLTICDAIGSG